MTEVPGIVSEDATTALRRIDFELLQCMTAQSVWDAGIKLWGLSRTNVVVHSMEQLRSALSSGSLAAYVYVYTWVPILPHAPWFPFAIIATDNKFTASWVFTKWRLIHTSSAQLSQIDASDDDGRSE